VGKIYFKLAKQAFLVIASVLIIYKLHVSVYTQEVCVCATHQYVKRWRCVTVAQLNCVCFVFCIFLSFEPSQTSTSTFQQIRCFKNHCSYLQGTLLPPSRLVVALPGTSWAGGFRARHDCFHHVVPIHVRGLFNPVFTPNVCTGRHEQPDTGQFIVLHCSGGIIRKRLVCHTAVIRCTAVVLLLYCCCTAVVLLLSTYT